MTQVWHTAAWYSMLRSSTTIRTSFVIVLKITINKHQKHGIPAVWCMEIASHPISPCNQHFCSLSSLLSITISDPWGHTLLSATVIQYKGSQSLAISHPASSVISRLALYVLLSILHYYFLSKVCFQSAIIRTVPLHFTVLLILWNFYISNLFHSFSHLIKFCYFTATLLTYKKLMYFTIQK